MSTFFPQIFSGLASFLWHTFVKQTFTSTAYLIEKVIEACLKMTIPFPRKFEVTTVFF